VAWLWAIVAVLVALLVLACWAIHLLFGQWRVHQQAAKELRNRLTKQAEEYEEIVMALSKRIYGLEDENEKQKDAIDKQAWLLRRHGITMPMKMPMPVQSEPLSEVYLIREEP
jgi:cell division protein FtsB